MAVTTKTLYDTDFAEWSARTAELLRAGHLNEVDLEHVAEEIEDLGKSDRREVRSQTKRLLLHLLKQQIEPERSGASWKASVTDARQEIRQVLDDSPSLRRYLKANLQAIYRDAVLLAKDETRVSVDLPEHCPYTLDETLDG